MATTKDTYALLRFYTLKHKSPVIEFPYFLYFVQRYVEKYKHERTSLQQFVGDTAEVLTDQLETLESSEMCRLEYDDDTRIRRIIFPQYYIDHLHEIYKSMTANPEQPFPSSESLDLKIPEEFIRTVEVKSEFIHMLENPDQYRHRVLCLKFPDNIRDVLVSIELVQRKLIEFAIYKIRVYLNTQRNADYIRQKLLVIFQNRDLILKDTLEAIIIKPAQVISHFTAPSEFSFSFWAHLTNFVTQEYRQKDTKLVEEHGFTQASHLLNFYNIFYKGRVQKEKDEENALKAVYSGFRVPPYAFTVSDIYGFRDKNGLPLTKRLSPDRIHSFLEDRIRPAADQSLPDILRTKALDSSVYYIQKDFLFQYIVRQVNKASQEFREHYLQTWTDNFRHYVKTEAMLDDKAFAEDLDHRLKAQYPLLYALLDYDLLSVARREAACPPDLSFYINNLFSSSRIGLKPAHQILNLQRKELLETAKLNLSFWEILPNFRQFIAFLKRIFTRRSRKREKVARTGHEAIGNSSELRPARTSALTPEPLASDRSTTKKAVVEGGRLPPRQAKSSRSGKSQSVQYQSAVLKLKEHFVGKERSLQMGLDELAERWNPLYEERAKQNLVEDVDAMIRDYFRTLKRGFRVKPPDASRLQSLAETLAENKAFTRIRRKDYFVEYIILYMVKLLGEK